MDFEMWVCLQCDRLYVEPEYDRDNFGEPICPYCGNPHEDNARMDKESISDLVEGMRVCDIDQLERRIP